MVFMVSFLLPLAFFSPLLIAQMLGVPLTERTGVMADNFGAFVLCSQVIGLLDSLAIIARKLKEGRVPWPSVGLKGFKSFQAMRYITGYYLILLGLLIVVAIITSSFGTQAPPTPNNESGGTGILRVMGSL
jgi:hypothetical protein